MIRTPRCPIMCITSISHQKKQKTKRAHRSDDTNTSLPHSARGLDLLLGGNFVADDHVWQAFSKVSALGYSLCKDTTESVFANFRYFVADETSGTHSHKSVPWDIPYIRAPKRAFLRIFVWQAFSKVRALG